MLTTGVAKMSLLRRNADIQTGQGKRDEWFDTQACQVVNVTVQPTMLGKIEFPACCTIYVFMRQKIECHMEGMKP